MDLVDEAPANTFPVQLRGDVNGDLLDPDYTPRFTMALDSVNEFRLSNVAEHPFHLHVNHVRECARVWSLSFGEPT